MKNCFKKKKYDKGFSLIEVIICIGIISVGIVSIINLFNSVLKNEINNKNKLIALYLAEENIEIIRQLRDNDVLEGKSWLSFLTGSETKRIISLICNSDPCDFKDGWEIKNSGVGSSAFRKIFYDTEEKYYGQIDYAIGNIPSNWQETKFKRWMTVDKGSGIEGNNNDAVALTIHVSYADETLVEISTYLYNWQ